MASKKVSKKAKLSRTKKKVAKAPAKKQAVKKAIPRKPATKKPVSKSAKAAPKKAASKKKTTTAMKPALQKDLTKRPVGRSVTRSRKTNTIEPERPVSQQVDTPATAPVVVNTPAAETVTNESEQTASNTEDHKRTVDQKAFDKFTAKGDPHQKLQLSSRRKGNIKPSGKKPLWN